MDQVKPSPSELWFRARGDGEKYRALMLEHGYVKLRDPSAPPLDPDKPILPCGITPRMIDVWRQLRNEAAPPALGTGIGRASDRKERPDPEGVTPTSSDEGVSG